MLIGCAVSALAVYYLLQQVALDELGAVLARAQVLPVMVLVLSVLGSLLTRAWRWQVYFLPERRIAFGPLLGTLAISYMASTFLPLRAGELVRAVFLGRRASVAVPRVVATILLEKLFDFLAIGVALLLLVLLSPLPPAATVAGISIAVVILLGFGFVIALAIWREPTLIAVRFVEERLPFELGRRLGLQHAARQFAQGTDSLREPRLCLRMLAWTLVTWLCSVVSGLSGMLALGIRPELPALLLALVLTSVSQAVPSSPGYIGVYHFWATQALLFFGVDAPTALAFAVLTHASSYGTLVVVGLIALWTGGYSFSDVVGAQQARLRIANPDPVISDA